MQISKLSFDSALYPDTLRQIASPPKRLFIIGELPKGPYVAIVGSRKPTDYGRTVAYQLAHDLAAAGVVIVSGLALGIDGIAHQAALDAGGVTVAVQARGLDKIYPSAHRKLAIEIIKKGAIISEYPEGEPPWRSNFVARNRIISGLSLAVIVPEATAKSGSLHTVNFALAQGKTVMAVPGNITSPTSAGTNNILKSGATPIMDFTDVLSFLDLGNVSMTPVKAQSKEEQEILDLLGKGINKSQELIEQSSLSASQFANIITLMEITGKVRNLGAGTWVSK